MERSWGCRREERERGEKEKRGVWEYGGAGRDREWRGEIERREEREGCGSMGGCG
jgi:hypothetical protein